MTTKIAQMTSKVQSSYNKIQIESGLKLTSPNVNVNGSVAFSVWQILPTPNLFEHVPYTLLNFRKYLSFQK